MIKKNINFRIRVQKYKVLNTFNKQILDILMINISIYCEYDLEFFFFFFLII